MISLIQPYMLWVDRQKFRDRKIKTRRDRRIMENLKIQNMNIAYQGQSAIKNATLAFEPNKLTGIVGPNGAGKSTLLKGIMGLTPLNTGAVSLYGKPLNEKIKKIA